jgi:hypothetical protein
MFETEWPFTCEERIKNRMQARGATRNRMVSSTLNNGGEAAFAFVYHRPTERPIHLCNISALQAGRDN